MKLNTSSKIDKEELINRAFKTLMRDIGKNEDDTLAVEDIEKAIVKYKIV